MVRKGRQQGRATRELQTTWLSIAMQSFLAIFLYAFRGRQPVPPLLEDCCPREAHNSCRLFCSEAISSFRSFVHSPATESNGMSTCRGRPGPDKVTQRRVLPWQDSGIPQEKCSHPKECGVYGGRPQGGGIHHTEALVYTKREKTPGLVYTKPTHGVYPPSPNAESIHQDRVYTPRQFPIFPPSRQGRGVCQNDNPIGPQPAAGTLRTNSPASRAHRSSD